MGKNNGSLLIKRCIISISLLIICLIIPLVVRTSLLRVAPEPIPCQRNDDDFISDQRGLSKRLSEAIQFKTVSLQRHTYNTTELRRFTTYIRSTFPLIHSTSFIKYQIVNDYSLLYRIQGKNRALLPYMLCAHMDVVPVDEDQWDMPPFEGKIIDDIIYGRGAVDNKCNVMGILEALEFILERKIQPERSFFIAFGHDEEVNGLDGALQISKILQAEGVKLKYLLDEGSFILKNAVRGVKSPIAMVGVTEKGYLTLKLTVTSSTGHSSMPPVETSIVTLSKALAKLKGNSHVNLFGYGPEKQMLESLAPYASLPFRIVFANMWLFSPLICWLYDKDATTSAMIRTTTAVTMIGGGVKENIVPSHAWALVNHRVHPSQSIEEILDFDRALINDPNVDIEVLQGMEGHPFSPYGDDVYGYQTIKYTIRELLPGLPVVPIIMVANTDTRWYLNMTKEVYRFSVFSLDKSELGTIHGHNERISIESYERVVNFYYHLIRNSDREALPENILSKTEL